MGLYFYLLVFLFILSLKNMSDIAKNLFEKNKTKYLEGDSSVEELINRYNEYHGLELDEGSLWDKKFISAYFLILNPDHENYDYELTKLETDHAAVSIHFSEAVHMGFIDPEGEVCRTILMKEDLDLFELNQIMPSIIFDSYKIK